MTMLSTIQNFCRRTNIPVPTTVYGSTDPQVLQLMAILEESGEMVGGTLLVWAALLVWRGNQPQSPSSRSHA